VLRTMLALAATATAGQIATGIQLQGIHFTGDTRLDGLDLKKRASDLQSQITKVRIGLKTYLEEYKLSVLWTRATSRRRYKHQHNN
jgi:hypothetical protein